MDKNIIVTGGNGYIGSHMCKFLKNKNYNVHIIDNFSTSPNRPTHNYGEFHNYDISDELNISKLIKKIKPECIYHFAARALVSESEADPILYYNENLIKTISLLKSCINSGLRKFIFSSTCATFGIPKTSTLDEDHPQNPINSYGLTKLLMEKCMLDLASKNLIDIIVFRYFNASGCSPDGELGENHIPETHLIPNIIKAYLKKEKFNLYGDNFPTPDGTCIRDFIHVEDLAEVHYKGQLFLQENSGFHDFNLGSEKGYSVKEVISSFEKIVENKLVYNIKEKRDGDPPRLVGNSKKAKRILNFNPKHDLNSSIKHTLNFFNQS